MGRVKLKIEKLESANARQVTYSKRKMGIMKKARELSILCDIDIMLLMFSPSGKPSICVGEKSELSGVIEKFTRLTPQERSKRKLEILEVLKKTFKKLDHDVDIQELLGTQRIEELHNQLRLLQEQFSEAHYKWSAWTNPENINDVAQVTAMEESLMDSLGRLRKHKEHLGKQIAYRMWASQQAQPISWLPNHDYIQEKVQENHNSELAQLDIRCYVNPSVTSLSAPLGMGRGRCLEGGSGTDENPNELNENAGSALQLGFQYQHQQPDCNFGRFEKPKTRPDLNSVGLHMNAVQEVEPIRTRYEENFPYSYLTSKTHSSELIPGRNYNIN